MRCVRRALRPSAPTRPATSGLRSPAAPARSSPHCPRGLRASAHRRTRRTTAAARRSLAVRCSSRNTPPTGTTQTSTASGKLSYPPVAARQGRVSSNEQSDGVLFPLVDGRRSTQTTAKAVFAEAARGVAPDVAESIERSANWHKDYVGHLSTLERVSALSPKSALAVASDGLSALHARLWCVI